MKVIDAPTKILVPFANTGTKRAIPVNSQIGITDGAASFTDGFPPKTFLPLAVGGIPPAGADFNGILNAITDIQQWQSAGGLFKFDAALATAIGGYPKGARVSFADDSDIWVNTVDDNMTDPANSGDTGWLQQSAIDPTNGDAISAFKYMTQAQRNDVKNLTHSIDVTVAVQKALDKAALTSRAVTFPGGTYLTSAALKLVNSAKLIGEAQRACTIQGASGMTEPLIASKTGVDLTYTSVSDMGFYGGADCIGLTVSTETAFMQWTRCDFYARDGARCFYTSRLLQTSIFDSCRFSGGNFGVMCESFTANANTFINCKFGNHAYASVYFRNSSVNNFFGCNFEGGGINGRTVIDVTNSAALNFYGCYFENGHTYLLNDVGSLNGVSFSRCHFTYAVGNVQYQILTDGKYVQMDGNDYYLPMRGVPKVFISGPTDGKLAGPSTKITTIDAYSAHRIASGSTVYPVSNQKDLLNFSCNPQDNSLSTIAILSGTLTLNFAAISTGGTGFVRTSRKYLVSVWTVGGLALDVQIQPEVSADALLTTTVSVTKKGAASPQSLTLQAEFTGFSNIAGSILSWAFDSDCAANDPTTQIIPSIA
jgi:hypothetical protein